jgi:DnaD/phage-associated family protein
MASDYWIKLYTEILDDPKMGILSDRLWRRFFELCLMAARVDGVQKSGKLPRIEDIAWFLRLNIDELEDELSQLEAKDLITQTLEGWLIVNFQKRQKPVTSTDRWRAHRDRKRREEYYTNETQTKSLTETELITESQTFRLTPQTENKQNVGGGDFSAYAEIYENEIGCLTPMISDELQEIADNYTLEWFKEAVKVAISNNARKLKYVRAVLDRWKIHGFMAPMVITKNTNNYPQKESTYEMLERLERQEKKKHNG